ncbi:MAG TPA: YHS domain-containing protein [Longimicrobiaceae bacterium]|nr:YHS domain-containing protein [Longimicrobiaceae bacterium]
MAKVVDPVCGMEIDAETAAARIDHGSHVHYFCSTACRDAFVADPARYHDTHPAPAAAGAEGFEPERHEPPHTTTGKFTAPKFGSAGSGGLEYEPIPEQHDDRS